MKTALRFRVFPAVILLLLISQLCLAQPQITKIEPPNWWTDYVSPVMVLLYGDGLSQAGITVNYPGVTVQKVDPQLDGKHAFLWLEIAKTAKPGTVAIAIHTPAGETKAAFTLSARQPQQGKFQGI